MIELKAIVQALNRVAKEHTDPRVKQVIQDIAKELNNIVKETHAEPRQHRPDQAR